MAVLAALLIGLSLLPMLLTRFNYEIDDTSRVIVITMRWAGVINIRKFIRFGEITGIQRVDGLLDIVPLVNGTFPQLWGRFRLNRMLIIRRNNILMPVLVTPSDSESFLSALQSRVGPGKG